MTLGKPSIRQDIKALEKQIQDLNKNFNQLMFFVNQQLGKITQNADDQRKILAGIMAQVDETEVQAYITATEEREATEGSEKEQKALERGIADGYMLPADMVGPQSLIVTYIKDAEGKTIHPGRAQYVVSRLDPAVRAQLLGKSAGTEATITGGGSLVVTAIYTVDVAKMQEVSSRLQAEEAAKAAGEAVSEAATVDAAAVK
jgi:hypothetical protein